MALEWLFQESESNIVLNILYIVSSALHFHDLCAHQCCSSVAHFDSWSCWHCPWTLPWLRRRRRLSRRRTAAEDYALLHGNTQQTHISNTFVQLVWPYVVLTDALFGIIAKAIKSAEGKLQSPLDVMKLLDEKIGPIFRNQGMDFRAIYVESVRNFDVMMPKIMKYSGPYKPGKEGDDRDTLHAFFFCLVNS